jgi:hypothetical protein
MPVLRASRAAFQHFESIVELDLLKGRYSAQFCCGITPGSLACGTVVKPPPLHDHQCNHVGGIFLDDLEQCSSRCFEMRRIH